MITPDRMVSWGVMTLLIAGSFASVAITKKLEKISEELPRLSECRPTTLELNNPVTRSQAANVLYGNGN